jgi:CRP/FNR family nitrogen fixation transcriptional regulator
MQEQLSARQRYWGLCDGREVMLDRVERQAEVKTAFQATGPVRHLVPNSSVFSEGDNATVLIKVISGVVRTVTYRKDGRRQIDAFYKDGDIFGFETAAYYSLSAETVSDCVLVSYDRHRLASQTLSHQAVASQLYDHSLRGLIRAQEHARVLGHRSALAKLSAFLIECIGSSNIQLITLPMARSDIADYLNLTVETVSRTLADLSRGSFINVISNRHILVRDLVGLRAFKE